MIVQVKSNHGASMLRMWSFYKAVKMYNNEYMIISLSHIYYGWRFRRVKC